MVFLCSCSIFSWRTCSRKPTAVPPVCSCDCAQAGGEHSLWRCLPYRLEMRPCVGFAAWSTGLLGGKDQRRNWEIQQGSGNQSVLCLLFRAFKCLLDPRWNHRHYKVEPFNTERHSQSKIPLWEKAFHGNRLDNNSLTCNRLYEMFDDKQSFSVLE